MTERSFSPKAVEALNDLMEWERKNLVPDDLKAKGWEYRDMPGWFSQEMWELLLSTIGEGEYVVLVQSERNGPDGISKRGQLCISPKGFENLKAYKSVRTASH